MDIFINAWVFSKLEEAAKRANCKNVNRYLAMLAGIEELKQIKDIEDEKANK